MVPDPSPLGGGVVNTTALLTDLGGGGYSGSQHFPPPGGWGRSLISFTLIMFLEGMHSKAKEGIS